MGSFEEECIFNKQGMFIGLKFYLKGILVKLFLVS